VYGEGKSTEQTLSTNDYANSNKRKAHGKWFGVLQRSWRGSYAV